MKCSLFSWKSFIVIVVIISITKYFRLSFIFLLLTQLEEGDENEKCHCLNEIKTLC